MLSSLLAFVASESVTQASGGRKGTSALIHLRDQSVREDVPTSAIVELLQRGNQPLADWV